MKSIVITTGEPSGIGMDIVLCVLANHRLILPSRTLITACFDSLSERAKLLGKTALLTEVTRLPVVAGQVEGLPEEQGIFILDIPCHDKVQAGVLNPKNAPMVERQLTLAHHLAMTKKVSAIVTAPIAKSVMVEGGICLDNGEMFSGHTEFFMHKAGQDKVVMMLANAKMKVALVTTHLPLKDVAQAITPDEVAKTVQIVHDELVEKFGLTSPRILVCGLNPHAGESGHLGTEETQIINPVLERFQKQGMNISLAMPADTLFTQKYLSDCDVVIAMYHDQGLAPLKSHGFGDTVNITLGLPYVRTSVDHGTALDLAGSGQASASSLVQAIQMAVGALG